VLVGGGVVSVMVTVWLVVGAVEVFG